MFMLFEAARSLPQDRRADFLIHIFRRLPRSEATTHTHLRNFMEQQYENC